jgi:manganese/zinc/iron transport system substrate-binding protein
MIADAARNLLGEGVEVIGLMGPGVDPHLYKASRGDLDALMRADVVIYNGLHLEGKMGDVMEKLARKKPVIAIGDRIPQERLRRPPEFDGAFDPHIWFDVSLWRRGVANLADTLAQVFPDMADSIHSRASTYLAALDSLDREVRTSIETIPEDRRVLVTAHDAFGYFGDAYGIEVNGLQGISTMSEFGLADRNAMVSMIVDRKIPSVFIESSVPRRNIDALVEGVQGRGHEVRIGGELFSDAMGEEGTPEGTYLGMVRSNVRTIVEGLR